MTRLSGKIVRERSLETYQFLSSDFIRDEFNGAIESKGQNVIFEKSYLCPCKSQESDHRNTCKNCGGAGWIFANPLKTRMLISGITADKKYEEWGVKDMGMVHVSAHDDDKISYMDRITLVDATAEHSQILYPRVFEEQTFNTDSDSIFQGLQFVYTKYDIKRIDFIGLFQSETQKIKRLIEPDDYSFRDNIIILAPQYDSVVDPCITIRYVHHPVYHIWDVARESMTSTIVGSTTKQKISLPIHAIAKRAHLIKDVENFDGDRLLDNSWLPVVCEQDELSDFYRKLRYTAVEDIFDNLTQTQIVELQMLLDESDIDGLGVNGGILQINP